MKYEEFRQANSTPQLVIEAFTNGLCSPDVKPLSVWSMNPLRAYNQDEIYASALEFSGFDDAHFPLTKSGVWGYYYGKPSKKLLGSLDKIGAVVKLKVRKARHPYSDQESYTVAYQLTDAGDDFGKAIAARACYLVNTLDKKRGDERPNFCSIWRIFGTAKKPENSTHRRGYAVSEFMEMLYNEPETTFRLQDLADETGIVLSDASYILNSLGEAGIITYISPLKEKNGVRSKGWITYSVSKENIGSIIPEDLYSKIRETQPMFYDKRNLISTIELLKKYPDQEYTKERLAERVGMTNSSATRILSVLKSMDLLTRSSYFDVGNVESIVKSNESTADAWEIFIEPIKRISQNLDPSACSGFYDVLDMYSNNREKRRDDVKNWMSVYNDERSCIGREGGEEIRAAILGVLQNGVRKLSQIVHRVNEQNSRKLTTGGIRYQLKNLIASEDVRSIGNGYYLAV